MRTALVGHTGLVGQNILAGNSEIDFLYNSKNIEAIYGQEFDLLICSGAPGYRRLANLNPEQDIESLERLKSSLAKARIRKLVLISTIEIYGNATGANEDLDVNPADIETPYARHRLLLEQYCRNTFDCLTTRLPLIFGIGLKKNLIYDLIHGQADFTNRENIFQFYDLANTWVDIKKSLENKLSVINFFSEPIKASEMAVDLFGISLTTDSKDIRKQNCYSKHWALWNNCHSYLYTKKQIYTSVSGYVEKNLI